MPLNYVEQRKLFFHVCCSTHRVMLYVLLGGRCCATGTTNSSRLALFVLLANSGVTSKATKNGKSMCKSLLHNPLLQQQAQSAAGCGLNENMAKPSRRLICNPYPGYSSQNNNTKNKNSVFVPLKSIGLRSIEFCMVQHYCKYKLDEKFGSGPF